MLGLEAASVFAIFTSQIWNMTFSFYASLVTLPRELKEATAIGGGRFAGAFGTPGDASPRWLSRLRCDVGGDRRYHPAGHGHGL